jgi:hypothetical protein
MGISTYPDGIRLLLPSKLAVSPMSLACPLCKVPPGRDCKLFAGRFIVIHVERFKATLMSRPSRRFPTVVPESIGEIVAIGTDKRRWSPNGASLGFFNNPNPRGPETMRGAVMHVVYFASALFVSILLADTSASAQV